MSEDPYLPRFKDQADSVAAERHPPPPNRDPDGTLLAAEDGTLLAAKSQKVSSARQAETPRSNDNICARAPPSSSAEATAILMAFDVVAVEGTTTGNNTNNNHNDIVPNIINDNSSEPAAPSQSNHDHPQKRFPWNTAIVAVAVVVIVIAVVAGVVVGVVSGSGGSGGSSDPSATTSSRSQDITNFINSKSYTDIDLSSTGTSPEERALQWLIHDDPLQLNVGAEVDEFRLLQRYSLLTFWFQADTGTTWINSTNWLNADECTWYGINCQSGVVTVVAFYPDDEIPDDEKDGNGLQGTLSPDLGLLTDLTMFIISSNIVSGSLPSEIGLWTNLEGFSVDENALTGTIPATIANWKLIESALFYYNKFSGSMPNGICEFITGTDELEADCGEVTCSCCTNLCYNT